MACFIHGNKANRKIMRTIMSRVRSCCFSTSHELPVPMLKCTKEQIFYVCMICAACLLTRPSIPDFEDFIEQFT